MRLYSLLTAGLFLVLVSFAGAEELKVCLGKASQSTGAAEITPPSPVPTNGEATYSGTVRVFLVEPASRWADSQGDLYSYALLDFPLVTNVDLPDGDVIYLTSIWDAAAAGFSCISEGNIMATAVVFRSQTVLTDANPPEGYYFQARYADAAAAATPFEIGHGAANPPYTHSVFIEESTQTW
jgi:hypothetical protein